jgi:predicted permease
MNLVVGDEPEQVDVQVVTPSFFPLLGAHAVAGRTFIQEEELPGGPPVVVLSHGLWQRAFGSDPGAVGRVLNLGGVDRLVVGIMPRGFGFPRPGFQAWVPYEVDPAQDTLTNFFASGLARLAPGSSLESMNTECQGLLDRLVAFYPEYGGAAFLADVDIQSESILAKEALVGDVDSTLWILLGTVGFVLLIACANVTNLALVRAERRKREMCVRKAIGAGQWEIFKQFSAESLILAGTGGILGLVVGQWALETTLRFIPEELPRVAEVGMDGRILAFAALLALGCALFSGFVPFTRMSAIGITNPLKEGGSRGASSGKQSHRLRNGLVVVQVALALVLMVGAGLMLRSFLALRATDPGFEVEGMLTARITVPAGEVEAWRETADLFRQLQGRLACQPGVEGVGFTRRLPLSGSLGFTTVELEDQARQPAEGYIVAHIGAAGPGYFETMGIGLVEGRTFRSDDGAESMRAAVISESFARRWWPNESPLGHRLRGGGMLSRDWWEVVGVATDVHQVALDQEVGDMIYLPPTVGSAASPLALRAMDVVVKTTTPPLQLLPVLRRELDALNPRIPLAYPRTVQDVFTDSTARTSFTMAMLGSSAGIALLLGLVGIYGVISYVVSLRTREIGIRLALGATTTSVRSMVVLQGFRLAVTGTVIGLTAAGILSWLMGSLLFGVGALDVRTYGGMALVLLCATGLASWLPAQRATAVDPNVALREE